ncbi:hypothetical protein [Sphingomonas sp. URHD0057]|uniref:hypothetical protein n=1 Tax=Sphingomonas sp. URHD0057 TaxID=1380389 RepID=UPI00048AFFC7|nr:hypothetical protein [Sphingomonas sp. URHD0057]
MRHAVVKIFGERNTATNALQKVIELNSAARCLPSTAIQLDPGAAQRARWSLTRRSRERKIDAIFAGRGALEAWKHCATDFRDASAFANVLVTFTVRHPASWLLSLYKHPYHELGRTVRDLTGFIHAPWPTVGRERLGGGEFRPLELYQRKLDSYFELEERLGQAGMDYRFVKFEDLILRQQSAFEEVAQCLFDPKPEFEELRQSTKDRTKQLDDYKRYYGFENWRSELTGHEDAVNGEIEWARLDRFGYAPL